MQSMAMEGDLMDIVVMDTLITTMVITDITVIMDTGTWRERPGKERLIRRSAESTTQMRPPFLERGE